MKPARAADKPATLDPELVDALKKVGAEQYARATAHLFAKGGKFNKKPKPRYALT